MIRSQIDNPSSDNHIQLNNPKATKRDGSPTLTFDKEDQDLYTNTKGNILVKDGAMGKSRKIQR